MKFAKYILPFLLFIPIAVIQLTALPLISIGNIIPDFLLILIVIFTLYNGQIYGTLLGASLGLLFDIVSGNLLGSAMFSKTIGGFIAGYFYNENKIENNTTSFLFIIIIFVCSTFDSFFNLLLTTSEVQLNASTLFLGQGILPALYTSIFGLPIIIFMNRRR